MESVNMLKVLVDYTIISDEDLEESRMISDLFVVFVSRIFEMPQRS
jgi:hypothetical protein